ncbi:MAG: FAD-dependent oxidoreductase [Burkholderiales bacterium]
MNRARERWFDVAIVGGGLVGAALAFGMRELGARVALLDEGDVALRASRGNFGLIWVQGKGLGMPAYAAWTQRSAREWPRFAAELAAATGIDVALRTAGGLAVCLSRDELMLRAARMESLFAQGGERYPLDVLDRDAVLARLPDAGPSVAGGTWCPLDGDCNPLRLLHALHVAAQRAGVAYLPAHPVASINAESVGFALDTVQGTVRCERVVLAAGLGNARLAPMVGLAMPVTPNQGHIVALERVQPFLPFPLENVRQTDDGTVLVGDAQRECGADDRLDTGILSAIAARAVRIFPHLRDVRVTRAWSALRVMSPDTFPIYAQSRTHRGAFGVTCHSGVTLAAVHALVLGPALARGELPAACAPFGMERFDVRAAA